MFGPFIWFFVDLQGGRAIRYLGFLTGSTEDGSDFAPADGTARLVPAYWHFAGSLQASPSLCPTTRASTQLAYQKGSSWIRGRASSAA